MLKYFSAGKTFFKHLNIWLKFISYFKEINRHEKTFDVSMGHLLQPASFCTIHFPG